MSLFSSEQIEALSSDGGQFSIDQLRALGLTTDQPSILWAGSPSTSDDDDNSDSDADGSDNDDDGSGSGGSDAEWVD